jgi:hypothetical protein
MRSITKKEIKRNAQIQNIVIMTIHITDLLFYYSIFELIVDVVHHSIAELYLIKGQD